MRRMLHGLSPRGGVPAMSQDVPTGSFRVAEGGPPDRSHSPINTTPREFVAAAAEREREAQKRSLPHSSSPPSRRCRRSRRS